MRMGKLALFALTSLSIPIFAETQVITLNPGWNLKGSLLDGVNTSQDLNQNGIITVWKWEEGKWAVWSPIPKLKTIIEKYFKVDDLKSREILKKISREYFIPETIQLMAEGEITPSAVVNEIKIKDKFSSFYFHFKINSF